MVAGRVEVRVGRPICSSSVATGKGGTQPHLVYFNVAAHGRDLSTFCCL